MILLFLSAFTACQGSECDPPVLEAGGIPGDTSCAYTFQLKDVVFGPGCSSEVPERMLREVVGTYEDPSYEGGALVARRIAGIDLSMAVGFNDTTAAGEGCDPWQFAPAFHLLQDEVDALARRAEVDLEDHRAEKVP